MADPVSLAITVALNVATMAMTMMNKTEGPRLQDLSVTTADLGTPLANMYGTMRVECPCFYAEEIREEKETQKGKSGKYAEYKYYGTWAVVIADHEIDRVLKLWLDRRVAYDVTGAGPISLGAILPGYDGTTSLGIKFGSNLRFYLGTEDQEPDPRMVATTEAEEGAGRTPAYLGVAYAMFEDVPLEKFGNRLPQCSALPSRAANPNFPSTTIECDEGGPGNHFAMSRRWMALWSTSGGGLIRRWYDVANAQEAGGASSGPGFMAANVVTDIALDGTVYQYGGVLDGLDVFSYRYTTSPLGTPVGIEIEDGFILYSTGGCCRVLESGGTRNVFAAGHSGAGYMSGLTVVTHAQSARDFCLDGDGNVAKLFQPVGSSADFTIECDAGTFTITGSVVRGGANKAYICHVAAHGHFIVITDGNYYLVDDQAGTVEATGALPFAAETLERNHAQKNPNLSALWELDGGDNAIYQFSTEDLSIVATHDVSDWANPDINSGRWVYDPINHAIWCRDTTALSNEPIVVVYLERDTGGAWTLGLICADVADRAGMLPTDYDFDDLDQLIPGYVWTQGPGKEIVGPLLEVHDSDIGPHQFIQRGLKRGQPLSGDTIEAEWLVPRSNRDGGNDPLYSVPIVPESQLPRRVFATFADPARDYQPNTVAAQRNQNSVETNRETSFDLTTFASTPDELQPLINRALRRAWIGAIKPESTLNPREIAAEPGDVRMLNLDGDFLRCRLVSQVLMANRSAETRWEVDGETPVDVGDWQSDVYASLHATYTAPGGPTHGRPDDEILIPQLTQGFVFDTPLLSDAHDQSAPFAYVAAAPFADGFWPGVGVWASDSGEDGTFAANWAGFGSTEGSVWGRMIDTLPDALAEVIDYGTEFEVELPGGNALSSSTEDAVLADQSVNLALAGNELIQFITATAIGENRYLVSGLVRGARGTEHEIAGHSAGERFLLIGSNIKRRDMGAGEIGDTDYYKFASVESLDEIPTSSLEFTAAAHKPLSPAHLAFERQSNGDWEISWVRRTRIGGSSVDGQDVPLGETSESYRLRILDGETALRTEDTTSASFTYTVAMQVADWGAALAFEPITRVCQLSPDLSLEGFTTENAAITLLADSDSLSGGGQLLDRHILRPVLATEDGKINYLSVRGPPSGSSASDYYLTLYEVTSLTNMTGRLLGYAHGSGLTAGVVETLPLDAPVEIKAGRYYAVGMLPGGSLSITTGGAGADAHSFTDSYTDGPTPGSPAGSAMGSTPVLFASTVAP